MAGCKGEAARTGTPFREEVHGDGGLHKESVERGRGKCKLHYYLDIGLAFSIVSEFEM